MSNWHDYDDDMANDGPSVIDDDSEPGICPACSGSGEGQHDGATCHQCKGKGEC